MARVRDTGDGFVAVALTQKFFLSTFIIQVSIKAKKQVKEFLCVSTLHGKKDCSLQ